MKTTVSVSSDIVRSARVLQCEGIFDVPPSERTALTWDVELPLDIKPWNIGLVVGPSGCGKSTVARALWPTEFAKTYQWDPKRSLLDSFPADMSVKDIIALLSSVGFNSPPSWVRPFHVLSNGEQFRVTMARVLAESPQLAVVDEFTSVVDRQVAQLGASCIAKTVRRRNQKFVAVSCHYDIEEWLQPDWVFYPADRAFAWRSVQRRPPIELEINRIHHSVWKYFAPHHYLTHELNKAAFCFGAFWRGQLVAFDAWLPFFGKLKDSRQGRRGHRTVCLPDYQGVGIGNALFTTLASMWVGLGYRAFSGTAHPAEIAARQRNPAWRMTRAPGFTAKGNHGIDAKRASNRLMASFEFVGTGMPRERAERMLNTWAKI